MYLICFTPTFLKPNTKIKFDSAKSRFSCVDNLIKLEAENQTDFNVLIKERIHHKVNSHWDWLMKEMTDFSK